MDNKEKAFDNTDNVEVSDVAVETVTSEEFESEMANANPPPKQKKKMTNTKKIVLSVVAAVMVVILVLIIWLCVFLFGGMKDKPVIRTSAIEGFGRDTTYIATSAYTNADNVTDVNNTISIKDIYRQEAFKTATFAIKSGSQFVTLSGDTLTVLGAGKVTMTITIGETATDYAVEIVDGVNVFNFKQMEAGIRAKKAVVLQNDIDFLPYSEWNSAEGEHKDNGLATYNDVYGNANKIDGTAYTRSGNLALAAETGETMFSVRGQGVDFINIHIVALETPMVNGVEVVNVTLDHYADGGVPIEFSITSVDKEVTEFPSGSVQKCVIEKSFKSIFIHGADVLLEGNILRVVADGNVSIETSNRRTSNITIKNNVLINPQVAGLLFYCMEGAEMQAANYVNVKIEGVLDIYNWKNETTAALMPITEKEIAGVVNNVIQKTLEGTEFDHMLIMNDGHKWVHVGIAIIASGKSKNLPNITGLDEIGYRQDEFPLPGSLKDLVGFILKTKQMAGYEDDSIMPTIEGADVKVDQAMFDKIWKKA